MLDDIAYKVYGDTGQIVMILNANPGLAERPLILPYGVEIQLPALPESKAKSAIASVWG